MKATTFQLRFYGQFYHAGIDICRNFNVLAHFQLASNLLPTTCVPTCHAYRVCKMEGWKNLPPCPATL
jgi:hypothetical protein